MRRFIFFVFDAGIILCIQLLWTRLFFKRNKLAKSHRFITYRFFENLLKSNARFLIKANKLFFRLQKENLEICLRLNSSDFQVYHQLSLERTPELVIEHFIKYGKDLKTFVDMGANIGLFTLKIKAMFPSTMIYCIEPIRGNKDMLIQNFLINQFDEVVLVERPIWYKEETLVIIDESVMEWAYSFHKPVASNSKEYNYHSITPNQFLNEFNINQIDYLKIDIEGAEKNLFLQQDVMDRMLNLTNVVSIEVHDHSLIAFIKEVLAKYGFQCFESGELLFGSKFPILNLPVA